MSEMKCLMNTYILTTERLGLRRWLETDIGPFIHMNMDKDVMKYFPKMLSPKETKESFKRINFHFDKYQYGLFAVEDKLTGGFTGFTGFNNPAFDCFFTPCVEIGWRYAKEFWGRGYATEAAGACLAYGFNILKLEKIVSFTSAINLKSENIMKKIGMKYVTDFEHPLIKKKNILCKHVLYQINSDK